MKYLLIAILLISCSTSKYLVDAYEEGGGLIYLYVNNYKKRIPIVDYHKYYRDMPYILNGDSVIYSRKHVRVLKWKSKKYNQWVTLKY